jgi:hypothetical protein
MLARLGYPPDELVIEIVCVASRILTTKIPSALPVATHGCSAYDALGSIMAPLVMG